VFSDPFMNRDNVGPDGRMKGTEVCHLRLFVGDIHLLEGGRRLDLVYRVIMLDQGCRARWFSARFRYVVILLSLD
jgi:hypothetical protein